MLQPRKPRTLQQALVNGDRLADLPLLAIQVAEDHVHFECVVLEARGAAQFFDRQIDLVGDEEVQPEDVVRRLARAAPVEPLAVAQLVALPRLADGEPGQQGEQAGEQRLEPVHARCASGTKGADDGVPATLGAQDQFEQLPGCAAPSGRWRDPVHALADLRARHRLARPPGRRAPSTARSTMSSPM